MSVATLLVSSVAVVVAVVVILAGMAMMMVSEKPGWGVTRIGYAGFVVSMLGVGLLGAALVVAGVGSV